MCEPVSYSRKIWQISAGTGRSLNVFNDSSYRVFFAVPCDLQRPPFKVEYKIRTENVCNYTGRQGHEMFVIWDFVIFPHCAIKHAD